MTLLSINIPVPFSTYRRLPRHGFHLFPSTGVPCLLKVCIASLCFSESLMFIPVLCQAERNPKRFLLLLKTKLQTENSVQHCLSTYRGPVHPKHQNGASSLGTALSIRPAQLWILSVGICALSQSCIHWASLMAQLVKNLPTNYPGSGRFPEEGNGYPLQYSILKNSMNREAWRATYSPWHRKESDTTE